MYRSVRPLLLSLLLSTWHAQPALAQFCASDTAAYWREEAEGKISMEGISFAHGADSAKGGLERAVIQNAKINEAYARLVLLREDQLPNGSGNRLFYWIRSAPHVSLTVGAALRAAYTQIGGLKAHDESSPFAERVRSTALNMKLPKWARFAGLGRAIWNRMGERLARGNLAVYRDLQWQHLAAAQCGAKAVALMLDAMIAEADSAREAMRLGSLREGWWLIGEGAESQPFDRARVLAGNISLLRVEQRDVLQELTYDSGLFSALGSRIFRKYAVQPIPDEQMRFPGFIDWTKLQGLPGNFFRFEHRIRWVESLVRAQADYFDQVSLVREEELLGAVIEDAGGLLAEHAGAEARTE